MMGINEVQREFEISLQRSLIRRAIERDRTRLSMFRQPAMAYFGALAIVVFVTSASYAMKLLLG